MQKLFIVALLAVGLIGCDKGGSGDSCTPNAEIRTVQNHYHDVSDRSTDNRVVIPYGSVYKGHSVSGSIFVFESGQTFDLPNPNSGAPSPTDVEQVIDYSARAMYFGRDSIPFTKEDEMSKANGEEVFLLNEQMVLQAISSELGTPSSPDGNLKFCGWTTAKMAFYQPSIDTSTVQYETRINANVQISEEALFNIRYRSSSGGVFMD